MRQLSFLLVSLAILAACRNDSGGNPPPPGPIPGGDDVEIYKIQGDLEVGSVINVRGVVVTAIDNFGARKGNIWVQEPAGGELSGVMVYGASLDTVATLSVGDIVDVENAVKDEFALEADTSGRTTTELVPPEGGELLVKRVGSGDALTPAVIDAIEVAALDEAARDAAWEKWEGVYVTVENIAAQSALRSISSDDPTFVEFKGTGGLRVDSSLTALPESVEIGACYGSVTGILDYFFNYKLLPTSAEDLVAGDSCLLPETDAQCDDGIDNDANGFTDCADFSCGNSGLCATTIGAVQSGDVSGSVQFVDVVVTAVETTQAGVRKGIWIQDQGAAALNNGVYVFSYAGGAALPESVVVGSVIDVVGLTKEYVAADGTDPLTEITTATITPKGTTVAPAVLTAGVSIDSLTNPSSSEQFEGVLVSLANVPVLDNALSFGQWSVGTAALSLLLDDVASGASIVRPVVGACLASVTGVVHYNAFDKKILLLPRSPADIVAGGTCN